MLFDAVNIQSSLSSLFSILRWLSLALVLLNYRAFPLMWHLRLFWPIVVVRIHMTFIWLHHPWRREYVQKCSPLGANPFELSVPYRTTVDLSDLDYNIHLSNSSYAKVLDIARMRAVLTWFPSLLVAGTRLGLSTSHFHFLKEIPAGAEYEIRINIVGWEEKWIHFVAQFVTYPKQRRGDEAARPQPSLASTSVDSTALAVPPENGSIRNAFSVPSDSPAMLTPPTSPGFEKQCLHPDASRRSSVVSSNVQSQDPSDDEGDVGKITPATSAPSSPLIDAKLLLNIEDLANAMGGNATTLHSSPSKQSSSELEYWQSSALPPLPEGAVLHCIHTSSYCFKQGRITIPPRVALVVSGFGDRERGRWERVQEIRNTRAQRTKESSQAPFIPPATMFTFREPGTERATDRKTCGGLREILVGGWKRYEGEGLWDLTEYEERRRLGAERFSPPRSSLLALSS